MKYQAQWGPKGFLISPEKIVTFDGFSTSIELNDDSGNDTSGTPPTNTTGRKPQNINLSITYIRAAGVDPRAQFEEWTSLVGKAYPFYISGKRFGPEQLQLKKIDLSGLKLSNDGSFLSCTVAVSLEEYTGVKTTTGKNLADKSLTDKSSLKPLSQRQKDIYDQKQMKLLEEKEKALEEKDRKVLYGGGAHYVYKDDILVKSVR